MEPSSSSFFSHSWLMKINNKEKQRRRRRRPNCFYFDYSCFLCHYTVQYYFYYTVLVPSC